MTTAVATSQLPPLRLDYLKECLFHVKELPPAVSPINDLAGFVELVKKEERKRKASSEDTGEHAAKAVKADTGNALKLDGVDNSAPVKKSDDVASETKPWHVDQMRSMQERAEKHAREQKRQGDANVASTSVTQQQIGALELADCVVLFVFAFWNRGVRRHIQRASRSGELESWLETANFVEVVRKAARPHGRPFAPVLALLDLIEGMILEHTLNTRRRQLKERMGAQIDRRDPAPTSTATNTPALDAHTPSSVTSAHSPPNAAPVRPVEPTTEHIKTFMRWSSDVERALRLRSDALKGPLSSAELFSNLPQTWSRVVATPPMPLNARLELGDNLRFAWPLDYNDGQHAFGHLCLFARSVLTEVAAKCELDWRSVAVPA